MILKDHKEKDRDADAKPCPCGTGRQPNFSITGFCGLPARLRPCLKAALNHRKMFLATARRETSGTNRPPHPPPTKPAWWIPPPWWGGTAFAVSKAKHEGKRLYTKSTKSLAAENSFVLKSRNEQSARRGTLSGLLPLSSISPKSIRPALVRRNDIRRL